MSASKGKVRRRRLVDDDNDLPPPPGCLEPPPAWDCKPIAKQVQAVLGAAVDLAMKIVEANPAELVALITAARKGGNGTSGEQGSPHCDEGNPPWRDCSGRAG
jgi:hypothetical protein